MKIINFNFFTREKLILFFIITLISFSLEESKKLCPKPTYYTRIVSFFHHTISIYSVLGSLLFKNYVFHSLSILIAYLGWIISKDNTCILTVYYNRLCDIQENEKFKDIFYYLNEILKIKYFRYILVYLLLFYNFINIILNTNLR
jgi:hypothetical protein